MARIVLFFWERKEALGNKEMIRLKSRPFISLESGSQKPGRHKKSEQGFPVGLEETSDTSNDGNTSNESARDTSGQASTRMRGGAGSMSRGGSVGSSGSSGVGPGSGCCTSCGSGSTSCSSRRGGCDLAEHGRVKCASHAGQGELVREGEVRVGWRGWVRQVGGRETDKVVGSIRANSWVNGEDNA